MRAVVYTRVSTLDQAEGMSLQTQKEAGVAKAEDLGADIVGVLEDTFTGTSLHRPAMDRLREMVASGEVDLVVVYDPDRFSRDLADLLILTKEFEKHRVKLEYVNFAWERSPQGTLFLQVRGAFAQFEHAQILERTSRGKRKMASLGRPHHFMQPYGYRHVRGEGIVVDPEAAKVVLRIYRMYADDGLGLREICRRLAADGVPGPRVAGWNLSSLHGILRNTSYLGEIGRRDAPPGSEPLRIEPLLTEELFERAQRRLDSMRTHRKRRQRDDAFLFQGLLRCARCGSAMGVFVSQRRLPEHGVVRYRYYRCVRREAPNRFGFGVVRCDGPSVRADRLDAALWGKVEGLLANPELFAERLVAQNGLGDLQGVVDRARDQEKRLTQAVMRLEEGHLEGDIPDDRYAMHKAGYEKRLEAARRERRQAERKLKALETRRLADNEVASLAERYANSLDSLSFETKRAIATTLIERVVVDEGVVEVQGRVAFPKVEVPRNRVS